MFYSDPHSASEYMQAEMSPCSQVVESCLNPEPSDTLTREPADLSFLFPRRDALVAVMRPPLRHQRAEL